MERRRLLWAASLALLLGMAAGAGLVYEGSPLEDAMGGAVGLDVPVAVRIRNVGTHDANVSVAVSEIEGSASGAGEFPLAAGATSTRTYTLASGRVLATVTASWVGAGTSSGRGTTRLTSDTSACDGDETLRFLLDVDTTRGVSFPTATAECA